MKDGRIDGHKTAILALRWCNLPWKNVTDGLTDGWTNRYNAMRGKNNGEACCCLSLLI